MHMWSSKKARERKERRARFLVHEQQEQHWGLIDGKEVPYEFANNDRASPGTSVAFDDLFPLRRQVRPGAGPQDPPGHARGAAGGAAGAGWVGSVEVP